LSNVVDGEIEYHARHQSDVRIKLASMIIQECVMNGIELLIRKCDPNVSWRFICIGDVRAVTVNWRNWFLVIIFFFWQFFRHHYMSFVNKLMCVG